MDLIIGLLWSVAFTVIILVLGALNYFLGQSHSDIPKVNDKKSSNDSTNSQQSTRSTTSSQRRKQARKQRQLAASLNSDQIQEVPTLSQSISSTIKLDEEFPLIQSSVSVQPIDEDQFEDPMIIEEVLILPTQIEEEQIVPQSIKEQNQAITRSNSSKEESIQATKPQASVAPVKQSFLSKCSTTDNSKEIHSKSNGMNSTCHIYSHPEYHSLPPRFQQQRQQKFLSKKSHNRSKKSSFEPKNHFHSTQISKRQQYSNNNQFDSPSSESDVATESSSIVPPPSTESQPNHSTSSAHFLDEFISIVDSTSFSPDQLDLILKKILRKHNRQHFSSHRSDQTLEMLLDETFRSEAKILAVELQTEKNRVYELSKINADLDATIRQLQQPNPDISSYQQTILHYQMHIKRLTDDNTRLVHQLHAYSIMPASINELKQQHAILNEQLRQINMRNNNLEKEISDGERARRQQAEIYQKVDTQKQERIEQLINDLNKYKKIEKDFQSLQENHLELEKDFHSKLTNLTEQRDHLRQLIEQLQTQSHETEQISIDDNQSTD